MGKKIRVGVLFGGRSAEHEVSVTSALSMLEAIDREKYEVNMIGINRAGIWLDAGDASGLLSTGRFDSEGLTPVSLDYVGGGDFIVQNSTGDSREVDVIFPVLHGPYGEDGTVQGLIELAGVAYVGSGVLGSAVGMDKEMMKRVLRAEGLPQVEYASILRSRWRAERELVEHEIDRDFSYPVFVKPANLGSSVGISKVHDRSGLASAIDAAAKYDRKIIVEAGALNCIEVEAAVLGNENPEVSVVGEVTPGNEFYDYNAKYIDDNSELIIPARIRAETAEKVREMARTVFLAVEASGLSRVDFFVSQDEEERILVNEINTMPGFTPISMYPKLWAASDVSYPELIDRIIQLALERHKDRQDSSTTSGRED
ncbi:MAG: D-alanine--D-alanine ligase family protein [Candidatus Latescibacterota bacterium]|nr:D-alanine--D-alanine ligase family protein [Candidatus Latescibacterota bacterium]